MTSRRILLINHEYPPLGGGSGNTTRHVAKSLARLGHKPYVLTAGRSDLPRDELVDGVTIRRLAARSRREGAQDDRARAGSADIMRFMASAMLAAPALCRQWKMDAALVFFAASGGPIGWMLKRVNRLPYVLALQHGDVPLPATDDDHESGPLPKSVFGKLAGAGLDYLWRDAGVMVANSDGLAELARRHRPSSRVTVIPAGADVDGITPKEDYSPRGDVRLLYVGRLAKQKGLDVLLPALAKISSALKWKLTLVGDGPEWPVVAALAARLAMIDRIELRGWQGWDVLPEIYRSADIFVLPSRDEGMPAALLEAMATGLPVVGTRIAGAGEAVLHGKTGLLVPGGNSEALADALTQLIADPSRWEPFGRAGRARAETYYSWTNVAEKWLEVIEQAIHRARP